MDGQKVSLSTIDGLICLSLTLFFTGREENHLNRSIEKSGKIDLKMDFTHSLGVQVSQTHVH